MSCQWGYLDTRGGEALLTKDCKSIYIIYKNIVLVKSMCQLLLMSVLAGLIKPRHDPRTESHSVKAERACVFSEINHQCRRCKIKLPIGHNTCHSEICESQD